MPPKRATAPEEEDPNDEALESQRLLEGAFDSGVLSRSRRIAATTLPTTQLMAKADGKDIVKRGAGRRARHLLVFNCRLSPAAAGRLGTLARLDTRNPVMYVDFGAAGRLKLLGTLVFPRNKYVVLRLGAKEVVCEDVLESMVVFSEAVWVGTREANPEELPLPMPAEVEGRRLHTVEAAGAGGAARAREAASPASAGEEEEEECEERAGGGAGASQRPQRRAARPQKGTAKRPRYAEDSDASFGDADGDDNGDGLGEEEAPRKLPRRPGGSQPASQPRRRAGASQPASQPASEPASEPVDLAGATSDDDGAGAGAPAPARKAAPAAKKRKPAPASADEVEFVDLAPTTSEGEDAEGGGGERPSQRPQRASRAAGKPSYKLAGDSEDEAASGSDADASEGGGGDAGEEGEDEEGGEGAEDAAAGGAGSEYASDGYAPSE